LKSFVKKEHIINYLETKFNDTTQGVGFAIGLDGMPLIRPMTEEATDGHEDEYVFIDNDTYVQSKIKKIPVAIPIINGEYATLTNEQQTSRISSSSWSVVVSFLVYSGSYVNKKLTFAIEEFRDKFLNKLDFLPVIEVDYNTPSVKPTTKYYNVVTTAGDIDVGGYLLINGDRYLEYTLSIDLDVSENIPYGNQFEFYIGTKPKTFAVTTEGVYNSATVKYQLQFLPTTAYTFNVGDAFRIGLYPTFTYYIVQLVKTYERVLPVMVSWGAVNALEPQQLLNNFDLTSEDADRAKHSHSLVASRGFSFNYTFLLDTSKQIYVDLFKETFIKKDNMNNVFAIKMLFVDKVVFGGVPSWAYRNEISWEYDVVSENSGVNVVYGDNIIFTIAFTPSWIRL